ncbi:MAG: VWA domain-containing protein [Deltaproteobacteria bacterium]|nr:VWA domain-containing protein [Candidatus Anaeroferrophillacea bacterium]
MAATPVMCQGPDEGLCCDATNIVMSKPRQPDDDQSAAALHPAAAAVFQSSSPATDSFDLLTVLEPLFLLDAEFSAQLYHDLAGRKPPPAAAELELLVNHAAGWLAEQPELGRAVAAGLARLAGRVAPPVQESYARAVESGRRITPHLGRFVADKFVAVAAAGDPGLLAGARDLLAAVGPWGPYPLGQVMNAFLAVLTGAPHEHAAIFLDAMFSALDQGMDERGLVRYAPLVSRGLLFAADDRRAFQAPPLRRVAARDYRLVQAYLTGIEQGAVHLSPAHLDIFVDRALAQPDSDRAARFLALESRRGIASCRELQTVVPFTAVAAALQRYLQARGAADIGVRTIDHLPPVRRHADDGACTDGGVIYLPRELDRAATVAENRRFYRLLAGLELGYIEAGSFDFDLERLCDLAAGVMGARHPLFAMSRDNDDDCRTAGGKMGTGYGNGVDEDFDGRSNGAASKSCSVGAAVAGTSALRQPAATPPPTAGVDGTVPNACVTRDALVPTASSVSAVPSPSVPLPGWPPEARSDDFYRFLTRFPLPGVAAELLALVEEVRMLAALHRRYPGFAARARRALADAWRREAATHAADSGRGFWFRLYGRLVLEVDPGMVPDGDGTGAEAAASCIPKGGYPVPDLTTAGWVASKPAPVGSSTMMNVSAMDCRESETQANDVSAAAIPATGSPPLPVDLSVTSILCRELMVHAVMPSLVERSAAVTAAAYAAVLPLLPSAAVDVAGGVVYPAGRRLRFDLAAAARHRELERAHEVQESLAAGGIDSYRADLAEIIRQMAAGLDAAGFKMELLAGGKLRVPAGVDLRAVLDGVDLESFFARDDSGTAARELDLQVPTFWYDEWSEGVHDYLRRHVKLLEHQRVGHDLDFYPAVLAERRGLIRRIRRNFELLRPEGMQILRHWPDGDAFDYDALLEYALDRRRGRTPSDRLYRKRLKVERDVAVYLLVDVSGSTKKPVAASAKTVLAVEKEAIVLFCEALERVGDSFAVAGFSGSGRLAAEFFVVKGFDEKLSHEVKGRVGALRPEKNTRMGPAVRHAAGCLATRPARVKLLIILSDGLPNDQDYSAGYAIADSRMAIRECRAHHIHVHAITINTTASPDLDRLYGDVHHTVIGDVRDLPDRLPRIYRTLTRQ